jgi:hypothetical protein
MQKYLSHIFFISIVTSVLAVACLKTEEFPPVPSIKLDSFVPNANGSAKLTFMFTDGDGDIGLNPGDTLAPYDINSEFYYNLFIRYYELKNGVWTLIPINNPPLSYRTPVVTPKGQNKSLNGTMAVDLSLYFDPNSAFDTIKLDLKLLDRALHESNIIEIGPLIKP